MTQQIMFEKKKPRPKKPTPNWVGKALDLWTQSTGGVIAGGRMGRALKPLMTRIRGSSDLETDDEVWAFVVGPLLANYLQHTDQRYATPEGFARAPGQCGVPVAVGEALDRGQE